MQSLYNFVFYLSIPFILLRLLWKSRRMPAYRNRWAERFGFVPYPALEKSIWVHAVSLGETIAAIPLIKRLKNDYPDIDIVVTTMTPTGSERVVTAFGDSVFHSYAPYDYPGAVKRFLSHINPKLLIIMETELWPNILHYTARLNVPILLANARLSAQSERGYKKFKKSVRQMLNNVSMIAAQSQLDAERFINIGTEPDKLMVVGNVKFEIDIPKDIDKRAKELRKRWGTDRFVWIAASTHSGEGEEILKVLKKIKAKISKLLLVLVPRHPERFSDAAELCQQTGFNVVSHKRKENCKVNTDIVIGDSIGELLLLYAAADVAFVGGSLVPLGGHNLLEPAAFGKPVIAGPHLFNFCEISRLLKSAGALIKINNSDELANRIIELYENESLRRQKSAAGLKVIEQNKGALNKLMEIIRGQI